MSSLASDGGKGESGRGSSDSSGASAAIGIAIITQKKVQKCR